MNTIFKTAAFITVIAFLISCGKQQESSVGSLSLIAGNWSMPGGEKPEDGLIVESWVKVNDTVYAGKSYEVINGDSTLTETIELVKKGTDIFYIPTVVAQNNQQPVSFRLTKTEGNKFTFENPQHDFPTTIVYDFQNDSTLKASVSGTINGEIRAMDFFYQRN